MFKPTGLKRLLDAQRLIFQRPTVRDSQGELLLHSPAPPFCLLWADAIHNRPLGIRAYSPPPFYFLAERFQGEDTRKGCGKIKFTAALSHGMEKVYPPDIRFIETRI